MTPRSVAPFYTLVTCPLYQTYVAKYETKSKITLVYAKLTHTLLNATLYNEYSCGMGIKSPVAIMFDWCNTIVKTDGLDPDILRQVLKSMDIQDIDISGIPNNELESYLACALGKRWRVALSMYESIAHSNPKLHPRPSDDIHELLEFLQKKNIYMAIVSNKHGKLLRSEVQSLGMSQYFSAVLGSGDTPENKPSPQPILTALEVIGIPPSKRVFFVGDSPMDIESAKRARCCPIAYDNSSIEGVLSFSNFRDFGNFVAGLLG